MTDEVQQEAKNDKELNFRALERKLEEERQAREKEREEWEAKFESLQNKEEDDSYDEPYVDGKKLKKELSSFKNEMKKEFMSESERNYRELIEKERQEAWLKNNSDFYEVMKHAEKFAQHDPELAETILQMPNDFNRQKLVYKNIKALGLHQEKPKEDVNEKINQNRRGLYYQPSTTGSAPYATQGDYSPEGQKNAYEKMKELQGRLRI